MTYDQGRKRTLLFGQNPLGPSEIHDTWLWDGEGWIQVADTGPSSALAQFANYDPVRDKVVLFGGGTWEWDGTSWAQVGSANMGPPGNGYTCGAWDSKRQRMVAVAETAHNFCATWEWDGGVWTQVSEAGPPKRAGFEVAYDDARQKLILFGGVSSGDQGEVYFGDTWAWDGGSWEQVSDFGPTPRTAHAMVYDKTRSQIVLFGGNGTMDPADPTKSIFGDTWDWDGTLWTQLQDMGPGGRRLPSLAYDITRGCVVLFGGFSVGNNSFGDTWELAEYS
jgi:hypothetical protein